MTCNVSNEQAHLRDYVTQTVPFSVYIGRLPFAIVGSLLLSYRIASTVAIRDCGRSAGANCGTRDSNCMLELFIIFPEVSCFCTLAWLEKAGVVLYSGAKAR